MSSYLHEDLYIVCTKDISKGYRYMQLDLDRRNKPTVLFSREKKFLLVEVDTLINADFTCLTKWNTIVSAAAFGGGLFGGLLLGIAAVGMAIPGPGWVVAAICVGVVATGALIGGLIGAKVANPCKCNDILSAALWNLAHPTVTFDQIPAITKLSLIQCPEGGTLLPFVSENKALEAASTIANWNRAELTLNGVASFAGGGLLGFGLITQPVSTITFFAIGTVIGGPIMSGLSDAQTSFIRNESESNGSLIYNNMNTTVQPNSSDGINLDPTQSYDFISPATEGQAAYTSRGEQNIFRGAIQNSQQGVSNAANANPGLNTQMNNPRYNDIYTNRAGNQRGMNNPNRHNMAANEAGRHFRGEAARAGIGIALLVAPFVSNWLGEKGRDKAAGIAVQDLTNSISIYSESH